jgi:pimeloyl-ACP methyl ester carboxylesterase
VGVVSPVEPKAVRLVTADGERLAAFHLAAAGRPADPSAPRQPGTDRELAVVLAHGFTGSWRKPAVRAVAAGLTPYAGVLAFDFRGHGGSTGRSTMGDREVLDVEAAVARARELGYAAVVTCGWSMGGSTVLRHAALHRGVEAVISVSAPSRWYVRDTVPMRRLHWLVERRLGRAVTRTWMRTRVARRWDVVPESPVEVVGRIAPIPLLIVHGDADPYFPLEHPRALAAAAGTPSELWVIPGFGHAENAAPAELLDRLGRHLAELVARAPAAGEGSAEH